MADRPSPHRFAHLALVVVLAAAAGAAGFVGARRHLAHQQWQEAQAALEGGDVEQARVFLGECLRVWPADTDVRLLAARAARQAEAYEEAEGHLTACEEAGDDRDDVAFERLLLRAQQGDYFPLAARAKALRSDRVRADEALLALAHGQAATHRNTGALADLDALLERHPDDVPVLRLKARLYMNSGKWDGARVCAERAVARLPGAFGPALLLARILYEQGRTGDAVQRFETLRQRRPDDADVLLGLARCRIDLGQPDRAAELLDALLARHPGHDAGRIEKARFELHRGRPGDGAAAARAVLARHPDDVDALLVLAQCLDAQGESDAAELCRVRRVGVEVELGRLAALARRSIEHEPDNAELCRQLAEGMRRLGRTKDAVEWYFCALQRETRPAATHRALAECFDGAGEPRRAAHHRRLADAADGGAS
jgi:tetratricopeptide (TPR) repeat protein